MTLGEVSALANTFRLLAFADDTARNEVTGATIGVYRRADFYTTNPVLKTEGNIDENNRQTETIDGQPYIKISSINDAYTGTRLFYSNGNTDEYKVKVVAQDYSTYTSSLAIHDSDYPSYESPDDTGDLSIGARADEVQRHRLRNVGQYGQTVDPRGHRDAVSFGYGLSECVAGETETDHHGDSHRVFHGQILWIVHGIRGRDWCRRCIRSARCFVCEGVSGNELREEYSRYDGDREE